MPSHPRGSPVAVGWRSARSRMRVTARGDAPPRCGGKDSPLCRRGNVAEPRGGFGPPRRLAAGVAPRSGPRQGRRGGHSPPAHRVVAEGVRGMAGVVVDGGGVGWGSPPGGGGGGGGRAWAGGGGGAAGEPSR